MRSILIKLLLFGLLIVIISNLKLSMRSNRNDFISCTDANNCNECDKNDFYKKCSNKVCYCCDFIQNKCLSQNRSSFF